MVVKVTNQLLENQVSRLATDNESLKKQLAELENNLAFLHDNASKISQKLTHLKIANGSAMLTMANGRQALKESSSDVEGQETAASYYTTGVQVLMAEFENLMGQQDELRKALLKMNNQ